MNGLGIAIDHEEIGARRPFRDSAALLPMAQRIDAEPEPPGELFLGHVVLGADRPHVDIGRDVNAVAAVEGQLDVRIAAVSGLLIGATLILLVITERLAGFSQRLR